MIKKQLKKITMQTMQTGIIPHVSKKRCVCMCERTAIKYLPKNEITGKMYEDGN